MRPKYRESAFGESFLAMIVLVFTLPSVYFLKWYLHIPIILIGFYLHDFLIRREVNRWIENNIK